MASLAYGFTTHLLEKSPGVPAEHSVPSSLPDALNQFSQGSTLKFSVSNQDLRWLQSNSEYPLELLMGM
jgi:hypothetical protein